MLDKAIELLKLFDENGFEAYIVGGFVRDYILKKESMDVDIATNATPKQIQEIFKDVKLPFEEYGSVHLTYKKVNFEITTFRMDLEYKNSRKPSKIVYTDNLEIDLKRRDFTMNTLCMDKDKNIIDLFNSENDINRHLIKSVGNPDKKLKEDALRILRAVRFATVLDFNLDDELKNAIGNNRKLLKDLSFFRKKQELNKIFSSPNVINGIKYLKRFKLDEYLDIKINDKIVKTNDPLGIWVQVNPSSKYQFTTNEKEYINAVKRILDDGVINDMELYREGTYVCYIAAQILGINEVNIYDKFDELAIKKPEDVNMTKKEIIEYLNLEDKSKVKDIFRLIEDAIINKKLDNTKEDIKRYLDNFIK